MSPPGQAPREVAGACLAGPMPPSRDRVLSASAAWAFLPPQAPRVETEEYLLVRYPDWTERPLQLVRFHPRRPAAEVLDEVLEHARELTLRGGRALGDVACWVRLDAPEDVEPALRGRGGRLDETVDVLALGLTDPPGLGDVPDVTLRWSEDLDVFVDAVGLSAEVFGASPTRREELVAAHPGEVAKVRGGGGGAVVAYDGARALGAGGLTMAGPDARLWGGVVRPEARGRGIYRAVLAARLAYAIGHGADLAIVKGRVETSGPILRRAGFAAHGQERSWLLPIG